MATLATLSTTTLSAAVGMGDTLLTVASAAGLTPGLRLYLDQELMAVVSVNGLLVAVLRGVDGTATGPHGAGATITIGRGDQFYHQDPIGMPPTEDLVSPWINVVTGVSWTAQGDASGPSVTGRWWQATVTSRGIGSLGVRTTTATP